MVVFAIMQMTKGVCDIMVVGRVRRSLNLSTASRTLDVCI